MAQLADIQASQRHIEETLMEKIAHFEEKLKAATTSSSKCNSIDSLCTEFQIFKQLVSSAFESINQQLQQLHHSIDTIETHHRRKALLINGIPEDDKENITSIFNIIKDKLSLDTIECDSVNLCYRLGKSGGRPRPILIRFHNYQIKNILWSNKTKLKGSHISFSEFLTKPRQALLTKVRNHFGMRSCWTQDGNIFIKLPNGERRKLSTLSEANTIMNQFPNTSGDTKSPPIQASALPGTANPKRNIEMRKRYKSKKP